MNSAQHKKNINNKKKNCCLAEKSEISPIHAGLISKNLRGTSSKSAQLKKESVNKLSFADKVYNALLKVPAGKITTYKDLANAIGSRAYRAVGTALKNNPYAPKVPCHRVVASDGRIGGFMGEQSGIAIDRKIAMLKAEGVLCKDGEVVEFEKRRYKF